MQVVKTIPILILLSLFSSLIGATERSGSGHMGNGMMMDGGMMSSGMVLVCLVFGLLILTLLVLGILALVKYLRDHRKSDARH